MCTSGYHLDVVPSLNNYNFIDVPVFQGLLISNIFHESKGSCRQWIVWWVVISN